MTAEHVYDPNLKICYDRIIPITSGSVAANLSKVRTERLLRASKATTPREAFAELDPSKPLPAAYEAVIMDKKWDTGATLRCRFLGGGAVQRGKVIAKAKLWEEFANIHLEFVDTNDEQIRIDFLPGQGSWSAVGRDCLDEGYFPKAKPTMNFGWLTDTTSNLEYERVVVHEFGHALGCIHEHQQPNEHLQWDVAKVYAQFSGPPNNWSKADIDFNILQHYSAQGIDATLFDVESIMLYQFPPELFLNHQGTPLNTHLSAKDKTFIASVYPKAGPASP